MRRPVPRTQRWLRWSAITIVVFGILAGCWWARTPRTLRVIARFTAQPVENDAWGWGSSVTATAAGLVIDEMNGREGHWGRQDIAPTGRWVSLRDWNGTERWRVPLPPYWPTAVSPDGRTLVALGPTDRLGAWDARFWRDGRPLGAHPAGKAPAGRHQFGVVMGGGGISFGWHPNHLAVSNAEQAWVILRDDPAEITVADARGVVATGVYGMPTGWTSRMDRLPLTLAPDGSALVMEGIDRAGKPALEYAALAVRGKRVVVTPRYAVSQKPRYLDEQGTLYCVSGAVYGPDGVLIREAPSTVVTPLLLFHAFSPVEYHGSRVAVLRPRIGQRWYVPRLADRQLAAASRDGRFVLTYETGRHGRPMPGLLRWAAARLPSLEDAWQRRHSAPRLCVYQAPGRLRARLNLQEGNEILELPAFDEKRLVQTLPFGYDISFDELYLSPNGRRAVVQCRGREGGRQFLVLGW